MSYAFFRPEPPPLGSRAPDTPVESWLAFGSPDHERSLVRRFERQVERQPHRLAARIGDASIAYAELDRAANRIAQAILDALGDGSEPVAVLLGSGLDQLAGHLGVLKAGKFCVPLDPGQPQPRLARILAETRARAVLTDGTYRARAADLAAAAPRWATGSAHGGVLLDVGALPPFGERAPELSIAPESLAYVFYTSGSTGEPKGVMQSHRNLLQLVRLYHDEFGLRPADRIFCPMPMSYGGGVWGLLGTLASGASLHRPAADGAGGLADDIERGDVTVPTLLTSLLRQVLREAGSGPRFPSVRLVYTGGEVLHPADVARFREVFPSNCTLVYNLASSEAGLISHQRFEPATTPDGSVHHRDGKALLPVGSPLDGVEVLLLDEDGRAAAPGEAGEIAVRSEYLSPGYWGDPERTRAAFRPDPTGGRRRIYATGDRGEFLPDGRLLNLGRRDHQVKVRGQRIGTGEIEAALRAEPGIADAAVVAREDAKGDARLVAYVAGPPQRMPTVSALRRTLAALLPASMIPAAFVFLETLPLSPIGKLDRAALPAPGRERPPLDVAYAAPRTRLEQAVASAWAEVLELDEVGVDDNFVELGGHSLAAAQLVLRLNERLGVDLSVPTLLAASTVAAHTQAILHLLAVQRPAAELHRALGRIEMA